MATRQTRLPKSLHTHNNSLTLGTVASLKIQAIAECSVKLLSMSVALYVHLCGRPRRWDIFACGDTCYLKLPVNEVPSDKI